MGSPSQSSQQTNQNQSGNQTNTNAASPDISTLLTALNGIISGSQNFSQFSQPQIQALTNTENAANASGVATYKSQAGGTANPNALLEGIATKGQQSAMQGTQAMQGILGGQSLEALLGPLSTIGGLLAGNSNVASSGSGTSTTTQTPSLLYTLFGL